MHTIVEGQLVLYDAGSMVARCLSFLNSSTRDQQARGAVAGCSTEVVGALQPSGDVSRFNFVYCGLHATDTDVRDRTTEGGCAPQGEKQTNSSHRPALRLFRAPAVMAHRALARCSFAPILV